MLYHFIAFLTVAIWGTTFVSTKVLLTHGLTPAFIFLLRFSLAYVGMATMQMAHDHGKPTWHCHSWRDEGLMLLAGMTGGSFYFLTENTALQLALAGNVSLIVCLAPLITALFACFIPGNKRAGRRLWTGSLIAFTGVAFVAYGSMGTGTASNPLLGNVLALLSASSWSIYQLVIKPLGERYGVLLLTRKVFGYGLLTILPFILTEEMPKPEVFAQPVVWGNLLYLGVLASLICYAVWNRVVEQLGSIVSANYIYLNPLVTCIASYFVLGEQLTPTMMVGGFAIVTGLYLVVAPKGGLKRRKSC